MKSTRNSTGWFMAMTALSINLILGILYSWSVIKKDLVSDWGWTNTEASIPYTVCVASFAIMMIFAGRAQDKYGPRPIAFLGGLLFGIGLIASSFTQNPMVITITFGLILGMGIAFGYSAVTPCAIKWFEPRKKGLISGIVVSGVGLSPVYIAPLTNWLIQSQGIEKTFLYLGIGGLVIIMGLSLFLRNPAEGFVPVSSSPKPTTAKGKEYTWQEMIKTKPFILLWLTYMLSGAAGLMLIGHLASIALVQAQWPAGFLLVIILSVFNALGRVSGGILSDKVGRTNALLIVFAIQAVNMFFFATYLSIPSLIFGSAVAGFAYGALFALFPAVTADYFGIKNMGVNYGLIFSGWGVAGVVGPIIGGMVADMTGTYQISYIISAVMLLIGAGIVKLIKAPVE